MKEIMNNNDPATKELHKRRHFSFRLNLFFFCTFLLFSILIVRLAMIQFVEGAELKRLEGTITEKPIPIPPVRGNIYDRNGYPIAYSEPTQSLFFRRESGQKQDDIIKLANDLADIFRRLGDPEKGELTAEDIIKRMDVGYNLEKAETPIIGYNFMPRRIKSDLLPQEMAYILEHRDELKWIEITEESIRQYNPKKVAVQLTGYMRPYSVAKEPKHGLEFYKNIAAQSDPEIQYLDSEDVGFDGLEYMYQEELRGKNGVKSYPVNAAQKIIGQVSITKPEKGNDLILTIDKDVQQTAMAAIEETLDYITKSTARYVAAPNAKTGYAVAMEVNTGKVIAMASYPDYDPNIWRGGISQSDLDKYQFFFKNGTISEAYPPYKDDNERRKHPTSLVYLGSTIKPLTVLIGLNERLFRANDKYYDSGEFFFGRNNKERIQNSDFKALGSITPTDAIAFSSNTFMAEMIGNKLYFRDGNKGVDLWDEYMVKFGLGGTTGSGLRGESAGLKDYLAEAQNASAQSALIRASWGQLGKYTTLQLAQHTAMLANEGKKLRPLFVNEIRTHNGDVVKKIEPEVLDEVKYPKEYWDVIKNGMLRVFKTGYDDLPYKVASKTGTSTQSVGGKFIDNAVFIAYAPAENPVLAVAVVVPEGGFGAYGAAPIGAKIFEAYDKHIGFNGVPRLNLETGSEEGSEEAAGGAESAQP
jgi:cell division protein FtsI/penicillin-binding protein 2